MTALYRVCVVVCVYLLVVISKYKDVVFKTLFIIGCLGFLVKHEQNSEHLAILYSTYITFKSRTFCTWRRCSSILNLVLNKVLNVRVYLIMHYNKSQYVSAPATLIFEYLEMFQYLTDKCFANIQNNRCCLTDL